LASSFPPDTPTPRQVMKSRTPRLSAVGHPLPFSVGRLTSWWHRTRWVNWVLLAILGVTSGCSWGSSPRSSSSRVTPSLSGSERAGAGLFDGHRVRFEYPARWRTIDSSELGFEPNPGVLWIEVFGEDAGDFVSVAGWNSPLKIRKGLCSAKEALTETLTPTLRNLPGGRLSSPRCLKVGPQALPAIQWTFRAPVQGTTGTLRIAYVGEGQSLYQILCSHLARLAKQIERGCQEVLLSFVLTS
jgi:hypothetical protein